MYRSIVRSLKRLDDLLEIAVLGAFRFAGTRRGLMLIASLVAIVAMRPSAPAPRMEPPPAVSAQDLEQELADLDLEDDPVASTAPVSFELECVTGAHGDHAGMVRFGGRVYPARPGSLIPSDGAPLFVVTRVDCNAVEAYDWMARQSVTVRETRRAGPSGPASLPLEFKVTALAGDDAETVGVLSYQGESFVVQRGSRVPDCGDSVFEVLDLDDSSVTIRDLWSGRKIRRAHALLD